jgi:hypothetical protein
MAKTRQTPRFTAVVLDAPKPMPMTKAAFLERMSEEFDHFTAERPRLQTNWYQSLREFANMKFDEAYNKEMK